MSINKNRRTERAAVNALRTLLELHDHIVQEIDGGNDHGEDIYVTFTEDGRRSGDTIAVQVKGGKSFSATTGYRVPVGDHGDFWRKSNVAIVCVVHDPETKKLYWANASRQLREGAKTGKGARSIRIDRESVLDDATVDVFVRFMKDYIAETGDLHRFLSRVSGGTFDSTDYLSYFENEHGEQLILQQCRGHSTARLWHSDLDWEPVEVPPDSVKFGFPDGVTTSDHAAQMFRNVITAGNVIVSEDEALWLMACLKASNWFREQPILRAIRDAQVNTAPTRTP